MGAGGKTRCMRRRGHLGQAGDGLLDVLALDHHEVGSSSMTTRIRGRGWSSSGDSRSWSSRRAGWARLGAADLAVELLDVADALRGQQAQAVRSISRTALAEERWRLLRR